MQWFEDCDPSVLNNCLKALDKIQHQYGCEVYALRLFVYFSKSLLILFALQFPSYGTGCNAALEDCKLFNNILKDIETSGK